MSIDFWTIGVVIVVLMFPAMVQLYVHRLPEAPSCPTCQRTTRPISECYAARWVPALAATSVGECTRCGWRGRMRWRWAARPVGRRQH
ncbi:MAG: hypothetical protein KY464_12095 [Gemmatimonadetes bacterium]|nr:hypothetical protein [Gemmatimonadota bacterium]